MTNQVHAESKRIMNETNNILQSPDKRLYTLSSIVNDLDQARLITERLVSITERVDRLWKFWLGMAAPQIGYNKRIVILKKSYRNYQVMVNPEILGKKWVLPSLEQCYSLKNRGRYLLLRYFWLKVKYQDLKGKYHQEVIIGPRAYTMQQEIDHIDGILISDKGKKIL